MQIVWNSTAGIKDDPTLFSLHTSCFLVSLLFLFVCNPWPCAEPADRALSPRSPKPCSAALSPRWWQSPVPAVSAASPATSELGFGQNTGARAINEGTQPTSCSIIGFGLAYTDRLHQLT